MQEIKNKGTHLFDLATVNATGKIIDMRPLFPFFLPFRHVSRFTAVSKRCNHLSASRTASDGASGSVVKELTCPLSAAAWS